MSVAFRLTLAVIGFIAGAASWVAVLLLVRDVL